MSARRDARSPPRRIFEPALQGIHEALSDIPCFRPTAYCWKDSSAEQAMNFLKNVVQGGMMVALVAVSTGCVVEPRDNYYDHDHHRYYHEHVWHECGERDDHCH